MEDISVLIDSDLVLLVSLLVLLLTLVLGAVRALRGPTLEDRMPSVQLFGTNGVALLLLLGALVEAPALLDVALVLALLSAVAAAAVTGRGAHHD